jgi:hypothetical protein
MQVQKAAGSSQYLFGMETICAVSQLALAVELTNPPPSLIELASRAPVTKTDLLIRHIFAAAAPAHATELVITPVPVDHLPPQ